MGLNANWEPSLPLKPPRHQASGCLSFARLKTAPEKPASFRSSTIGVVQQQIADVYRADGPHFRAGGI